MAKTLAQALEEVQTKKIPFWTKLAIDKFHECLSNDNTLVTAFRTRESLEEYQERVPSSDDPATTIERWDKFYPNSSTELNAVLDAIDLRTMPQRYRPEERAMLITEEVEEKNAGEIIPTVFAAIRGSISIKQKLRYDAAVAEAEAHIECIQKNQKAKDGYSETYKQLMDAFDTEDDYDEHILVAKSEAKLVIREALAKEILEMEYEHVLSQLREIIPYLPVTEASDISELIENIEARFSPAASRDPHARMGQLSTAINHYNNTLQTLESKAKADFHKAQAELGTYLDNGPILQAQYDEGLRLLNASSLAITEASNSQQLRLSFLRSYADIFNFISENKRLLSATITAGNEAVRTLRETLDDDTIEESCKTTGRAQLAYYETLKDNPIINERATLAQTFTALATSIREEQQKRTAFRDKITDVRASLQMLLENPQTPTKIKERIRSLLETPVAKALSADELEAAYQSLDRHAAEIRDEVAALEETLQQHLRNYDTLAASLKTLTEPSPTIDASYQVHGKELLDQGTTLLQNLRTMPRDEALEKILSQCKAMRNERAALSPTITSLKHEQELLQATIARWQSLISERHASNPFSSIPTKIITAVDELLREETPMRIEGLAAKRKKIAEGCPKILDAYYLEARRILEIALNDETIDDSLKANGRALLSNKKESDEKKCITQSQTLMREASLLKQNNESIRATKQQKLEQITASLSTLALDSSLPNENKEYISQLTTASYAAPRPSFAELDEEYQTRLSYYGETVVLLGQISDFQNQIEQARKQLQKLVSNPFPPQNEALASLITQAHEVLQNPSSSLTEAPTVDALRTKVIAIKGLTSAINTVKQQTVATHPIATHRDKRHRSVDNPSSHTTASTEATENLSDEVDTLIQTQFSNVLTAIHAMERYGNILAGDRKDTAAQEKGQMVIRHAQALRDLLKATNIQDIKQFKADFRLKLHELDNHMNEHRDKWRPILTNIAIAITGLGAVLLAAHVIYYYAKHHNPTEKHAFNKALFFAKTASQSRVDKVDKALDDDFPGQEPDNAQAKKMQ